MLATTLHLSICGDCSALRLDEVRAVLSPAGMPETVLVKESPCLGPCERPLVLSLQSPGQAGYVFAGIDVARDASDIVATCASRWRGYGALRLINPDVADERGDGA